MQQEVVLSNLVFEIPQGAWAGILMGLGQLSQSELRLKRLCNKHGILGLDRVFLYAVNEWIRDVKRHQLPSLLGGVGPMHSFIQLCKLYSGHKRNLHQT